MCEIGAAMESADRKIRREKDEEQIEIHKLLWNIFLIKSEIPFFHCVILWL